MVHVGMHCNPDIVTCDIPSSVQQVLMRHQNRSFSFFSAHLKDPFTLQTLMARLKAKRFRQIFKYLDQNGDGFIDLLDLTTGKSYIDMVNKYGYVTSKQKIMLLFILFEYLE